MSVERVSRMMLRRPGPGQLREQLFWLVDVVYACKSSGDQTLEESAALVEEAVGLFGSYMEKGDDEALERAVVCIEQFGAIVRNTLNAASGRLTPQESV